MLSREDEGGSQNPTINVLNHDHDPDPDRDYDHDPDRDYDLLLEKGVGEVSQEELADDINTINTGKLRRIIRQFLVAIFYELLV